MPSNDLSNITEIKELVSFNNVNTYLNEGWVLISTRVYNYGADEYTAEKTIYSLGWPQRTSPIHPEIARRGERDTLS